MIKEEEAQAYGHVKIETRKLQCHVYWRQHFGRSHLCFRLIIPVIACMQISRDTMQLLPVVEKNKKPDSLHDREGVVERISRLQWFVKFG